MAAVQTGAFGWGQPQRQQAAAPALPGPRLDHVSVRFAVRPGGKANASRAHRGHKDQLPSRPAVQGHPQAQEVLLPDRGVQPLVQDVSTGRLACYKHRASAGTSRGVRPPLPALQALREIELGQCGAGPLGMRLDAISMAEDLRRRQHSAIDPHILHLANEGGAERNARADDHRVVGGRRRGRVARHAERFAIHPKRRRVPVPRRDDMAPLVGRGAIGADAWLPLPIAVDVERNPASLDGPVNAQGVFLVLEHDVAAVRNVGGPNAGLDGEARLEIQGGCRGDGQRRLGAGTPRPGQAVVAGRRGRGG